MKTQLIAVDMDGTCIDHKHRVPEKNLWALTEACKAGILVVPATGRPLAGYPVEIRKLSGIRYVITSNGARVTDLTTGEHLREVLIPRKDAVEFLEELAKLPVWVSIHKDGENIDKDWVPNIVRKLFYHGDYENAPRIRRLAAWLRRQESGVEKIQVFFRKSMTREALEELLSRWPELTCAAFSDSYVEITAKGATKGDALEFLCRRLDIPQEKVMAIGDSENDISMLRFAGQAVAMGNAEEKVKEAAVMVTATNEECGVARTVMSVVRDNE